MSRVGDRSTHGGVRMAMWRDMMRARDRRRSEVHLPGGATAPPGDLCPGSVCVLTRMLLRVHAQLRQIGLIRCGTLVLVPQNQMRKALGGGTAFVHHAS